MATAKERIRAVATTDYPWPYLAMWERLEDGDWIEIEAEGGDTALEAIEALRAEHPRCAYLLNGYRVNAR